MCFHFLNEQSAIYSGANPYDVSDYVNQHVGSHDLKIRGHGKGSARLNHRRFGMVDLCRLSYGGEAQIVSSGLSDIYHVQFILQGQCHFEWQAGTDTYSAGHILVINPGDPLDLTYSSDCEKFILKVPTSLIHDVCIEHKWAASRNGIRFSPIPYRFEELENLLYLLTLICQEAESATLTPQVLGHYNRVIATKLMTMLRHNVSLESEATLSATFDRLVHYIDEHIKQDLSVEDLARQTRMSVRSLYDLFEKHAKTTPKCFIKRRKLEGIHLALTDPSPRIGNITTVALDYGFTHMGRFSESYRAAFGELPSDTLKACQTRMGLQR